VVLDLGGVFAVTELDLVVAFGAHSSGGGSSGNDAPQSVRLQVGASPDSATFQTVLALTVPHPTAPRRAANGTNGTATVEEGSFFADGFTNAPQYSARSAAAAGANGRTPGDINPRYSAVRFWGYTKKTPKELCHNTTLLINPRNKSFFSLLSEALSLSFSIFLQQLFSLQAHLSLRPEFAWRAPSSRCMTSKRALSRRARWKARCTRARSATGASPHAGGKPEQGSMPETWRVPLDCWG
jgi:hypothetical protein